MLSMRSVKLSVRCRATADLFAALTRDVSLRDVAAAADVQLALIALPRDR